ncbi:hypothetical protein [Mesorhizobium sp. NPDC059025]|uniref:hypothetical protein n=1 Tax=unclassified Mesorhizobium TaxID=325217 RepID=UPI0036C80DEF
MEDRASQELRAFVYEGIRRGAAKGFDPSGFIKLLDTYEMKRAISKLVTGEDIHGDFQRLIELELVDWSVEAAVVKFPTEFSERDIECAKLRLSQGRQGA